MVIGNHEKFRSFILVTGNRQWLFVTRTNKNSYFSIVLFFEKFLWNLLVTDFHINNNEIFTRWLFSRKIVEYLTITSDFWVLNKNNSKLEFDNFPWR